ncbi:hypothetical protein BAUCODRAFT_56026, partial [Baudoinia panamericana UAMH 10762]
LRHLHLPTLTPYTHVSTLQDRLVRSLLAHKASTTNFTNTPPNPTVITAEFTPVYTCGRREVGTLSAQQKAYLTEQTTWGQAEFHEALRGGQTTFHGPGQLVAYPILDLRRHALTPRCWVNALEGAVIATCAAYGVEAGRTENPGVWVHGQGQEGGDERKICAVGVHLRRNVTSHGIGLNVSTELGWFRRIVACGLEGKGTTSLQAEIGDVRPVPSVEEVGGIFVEMLARNLYGVDGVEQIDEADI